MYPQSKFIMSDVGHIIVFLKTNSSLTCEKLLSIFIVSVVIGQYDYSLEDINPTSENYGGNGGASFFENKIQTDRSLEIKKNTLLT